MAISAIQVTHIEAPAQNHMEATSVDSMSLESLVAPESSHSVSTFQAALQQSVAQNAALSSASSQSSSYSSQSMADAVGSLIDRAQNSRAKIGSYAANGDKLSPRDFIGMQEAMETYTITTQLLSKAATVAIKGIDTLVHMQ